MPETTPGAPMAKWWIVIAIIAVVAIAGVYLATRHSQHIDANATANGTGQGAAYDATSGNVVPADATANSLRTGAPNTLGEDAGNVGGAAGGTESAAYGPNGAQGNGTGMPGGPSH